MICYAPQGKIITLHAYKNQAKLVIRPLYQGLDLKMFRKFGLEAEMFVVHTVAGQLSKRVSPERRASLSRGTTTNRLKSELIDGLGPNGKLMVIGATFDPIEVTPVQLIGGSRNIQGWAAGTPADSEDTLNFAEFAGARPMIETYPLEMAGEAYARMMSGKAEFRVVLTM